MKKNWISAIILCCNLHVFAQQAQDFSWKAKLPVPDTTGYYHIAITPALSARAYQAGNWDIRIFSGETEIPYVLNQDFLEDKNTNTFKSFSMPLLEVKPNAATTVIFELLLQKPLSEFQLRYTNTTVRKQAQLTASNDKVIWYALREPFLLDPSAAITVEGKATLLEETIAIPASSFRYYKLVLNDSASAPLQINCVGHRRIPQLFPAHTAIPGVTMKLLPGKDRREDRYLIDLHDNYPLTHLTIRVKAPLMYHRSATLSAPVQHFILSSETPMTQVTLQERGMYDSIWLNISNGDNPPLELDKVEAWQNTYYLIAHLEKGKTYSLKGGAPGMQIPRYDAEHFREVYASLAQHMMQPEPPVMITKVVTSPTFFNSRWWVWAGIIFIVALLVMVVFRMLKDMAKEGKQQD